MQSRQDAIIASRLAENFINGSHVIESRSDAWVRVGDERYRAVREYTVEVRKFLLVHAERVDLSHDVFDDVPEAFLLRERSHLEVDACVERRRCEKGVQRT